MHVHLEVEEGCSGQPGVSPAVCRLHGGALRALAWPGCQRQPRELCCCSLGVEARHNSRAQWLGLTTHVELGVGERARRCFLWPRKTAMCVCFPCYLSHSICFACRAFQEIK